MSQTTIQFEHRVSGQLTDAASVALDPTGLIRSDTRAVVVAGGSALARTALGIYDLTFTNPAPGLSYSYSIIWTYAGSSFGPVPFAVAAVAANNANPYCTIAQLSWFFDSRMAGMLANDANTGIADTDKLQGILDSVASELESHLFGRVSLPLSFIPPVLTEWVAIRAADRLYGRRSDGPNKIAADVQWAKEWIEKFDRGQISLPRIGRSMPSYMPGADSRLAAARADLTAGL